ncbi:helix-turn-helix transcriptional regulator [Streptomyces sp. NPDC002054]|uniref:helix-turn-helix transcriptional regulator n=1 Tax=Streptomyces sp. NPDC002054 TaxID=3154663 RepID=UPI00332E1963
MTTTETPLGEFLRARRAGVRPQDVGMPSHGVRRVPGLRREEVAVLAGVNADYYTRLEQGRERHPSAQVTEGIGRALRLDADARAHLSRLAGTVPGVPRARAAYQVPPALRQLLDSHRSAAAFVIDRTLDVLAANDLAVALHSPFERMDNLARMVFLDPAARRFYTRWDATAEATAGHLRQAAGLDPDAGRLRELVSALCGHSTDFGRLWNNHVVTGKTQGTKHFLHPDAGPLTLTYLAFDIRDAPDGQQLIVYQADPDSPSAEALALLRTGGL